MSNHSYFLMLHWFLTYLRLHLSKIAWSLMVGIVISTALTTYAQTSQLTIIVEGSGGGVDPTPAPPVQGAPIFVPPDDAQDGTIVPPLPPGEGITIGDFTPKAIIDRYPFMLKVYGNGLSEGDKIVIGNKEFVTLLKQDKGGVFLQTVVAGYAFKPGAYAVAVHSNNSLVASSNKLQVIKGYYAAKLVSKSPNVVMNYGDSAMVSVKLQNTGNITWYRSGSHPVRIGTTRRRDRASAFEYNWIVNKNRPVTFQEADVKPGEIGTFNFMIKSNTTGPRLNREYFGVVAEFEEWFNSPDFYWDVTVNNQPSLLSRMGQQLQHFQALPKIENTGDQTEVGYSKDLATPWLEKIFQALLNLIGRF